MFFNIVSAKECQVLTNPFVECPPIRGGYSFFSHFICLHLFIPYIRGSIGSGGQYFFI